MKALPFLVLSAALVVAGCGDESATAKRSPMPASAFKGAKVRVFNMSAESFEALLNGLSYGRPLERQTASPFKLAPTKSAVKVVVKAEGGDEEFEIPVEKGKAYTLVYFGKGKSSVIEGEPTEVTNTKSMVHFESLSPNESGSVNVKSGAVTDVTLANKEDKEVATGSYVATYKLANGKEATTNFDLAGGHVVSIYLVNDGKQDNLVVVLNHNQMVVLGPGGASPTG